MKETIEIRRWDNDEVIFSHTCSYNTMRKTVIEAIRQGISLAYANLFNANLSNIDFSGVNLSHANLNDCWLNLSDLTNAKLDGADLTNSEMDLCETSHKQLINAKGINNQCPKEGSFIGWKKCVDTLNKEYIVKLEIPADAKRSSATTNKCRCDKAKVLEIQNLDGTISDMEYMCSWYDLDFKYYLGEYKTVNVFDDRFWIECTNGIHFFMNREDAVDFSI